MDESVKELIERLAEEAAQSTGTTSRVHRDWLPAFAALVAEECAKVCEAESFTHPDDITSADGVIYNIAAADCAAAIRAKFT